MKAPKICIIGLEDYGLLTGDQTTRYIGGETVQHVLLARAWRDLGMDVSMIVWDEGQGRVSDVDGIRVIAAHGRDAGLPGLRFLHPRLTGLMRAMRDADADIYYQSLSGVHTGYVAWFCRRHRRRFVFRIASDAYCIPGQQLIRYWRDRKIYEFGLRRADLILAQTDYQRQLLRKNYALESELVNMVVEPPRVTPGTVRKDIDVLWVSNFRPVKRPDLAVQLAERLPHVRFTIAGGGTEADVARMRSAATRLANLTYVGPMPYSQIGALFDRAKIFLNTSSLEGFPNTFLQAWVREVPVVTFFDPDGLVTKLGLGIAASNLDHMELALRQLLADEVTRRSTGERAADFVSSNFSMPAVAEQTSRLFARHFGADFAPIAAIRGASSQDCELRA